jgi:hypothetical protein
VSAWPGAVEDLPAHAVDDLALLVHHVVVLEQVLADLEVVRLDALLRGGRWPRVTSLVLDRLALLHAEAIHDLLDPLRAEDAAAGRPRARVEAREPGSPCGPSGPRSWLSIRRDSCRSVPTMCRPPCSTTSLCSGLGDRPASSSATVRHVRAPRWPGRRPFLRKDLLGQEVGVAAEQDVGPATGHVGGDRHRALGAGLGDDLGLALVILGVEDPRASRRAVLSRRPRRSDFSIDTVPTRTGCPLRCAP